MIIVIERAFGSYLKTPESLAVTGRIPRHQASKSAGKIMSSALVHGYQSLGVCLHESPSNQFPFTARRNPNASIFSYFFDAGRSSHFPRPCHLRSRTRMIPIRYLSPSSGIHWQESCVTNVDRRKLLNQKGCIVWITGLSGSGKSTVAFTMDRILMSMGKLSYVLDGDNIRHGLCKNLGFSAADRQENIRRIGEVATLFTDAGLITPVSFISPYKRDRDIVRGLVPQGHFIEVFMNVPLEVCERRDVKGLYKLARAGVIKGFTGIDDPYEKPENPEIALQHINDRGVPISPDEMAWTVIKYLSDKGFFTE